MSLKQTKLLLVFYFLRFPSLNVTTNYFSCSQLKTLCASFGGVILIKLADFVQVAFDDTLALRWSPLLQNTRLRLTKIPAVKAL